MQPVCCHPTARGKFTPGILLQFWKSSTDLLTKKSKYVHFISMWVWAGGESKGSSYSFEENKKIRATGNSN